MKLKGSITESYFVIYAKIIFRSNFSTSILILTVIFLLDRPIPEILPLISLIAISVIRLIPAFNGITKSISSMKYNQASLDLIVKKNLTILKK